MRLQLVGTCSDTDTLGELVDTLQPAVVVTDACLPPDDDGGLAFVRGLRDVVPRIGVVVLSRSVDPTYGAALFESGSEARAYLLKGRGRVAEPGWLGDAISEVAAGRSVVDPKLVDGLFSARRRPASPVELLTAREREVLALIATGMSNGAIAAELWLSKRAVEVRQLDLRDARPPRRHAHRATRCRRPGLPRGVGRSGRRAAPAADAVDADAPGGRLLDDDGVSGQLAIARARWSSPGATASQPAITNA